MTKSAYVELHRKLLKGHKSQGMRKALLIDIFQTICYTQIYQLLPYRIYRKAIVVVTLLESLDLLNDTKSVGLT